MISIVTRQAKRSCYHYLQYANSTPKSNRDDDPIHAHKSKQYSLLPKPKEALLQRYLLHPPNNQLLIPQKKRIPMKLLELLRRILASYFLDYFTPR